MRIADPIPLEVAAQLLLDALPALTGRDRTVGLGRALGRVLARAVRTPGDLPPFDRSLVDGFAVRVGDGPCLPLAFRVAMGDMAPPLPPGSAAAVPTGGMVPDGADAMVMQEQATLAGGQVALGREASPGQNIVRRGADARAGDVALPAGRRLRPPEIAMLATVGAVAIRVRARPRIAVLSTGDELAAAGQAPRRAQVPDSNGPALCAALARDGAEPVRLPPVPDERVGILAAVAAALRAHDGLLCTGGSSVGERDYVQGALAEAFGAPPLFSGIAIRPGRPTAAFAGGGRFAVALPGHAVSALVVYELLVRPAVLRFGGEAQPRPRGVVTARLAAAVRAPADRDVFERVRLEGGEAVPLRGVSATIGNLARADALVRCPAGGELAAGSTVAAALLD